MTRKKTTMLGIASLLMSVAIVFGWSISQTPSTPEISVKPSYIVEQKAGEPSYAVFKVVNKGRGSDTVVGASLSPNVATEVQVQSVEGIAGGPVEIPAKSEILFTGYPHVALKSLKEEIKVGQKLDLTLDFEKSADITTTFTVTAVDGHSHSHIDSSKYDQEYGQ